MSNIYDVIFQNKKLPLIALTTVLTGVVVLMLTQSNVGKHCILVADEHNNLRQGQCFDTFAGAAHYATDGQIDSRLSDEAALASLRQIDKTAGQTHLVGGNVGSGSSVLAVLYDDMNKGGDSGLILASSGCDAGGKNYDFYPSWQFWNNDWENKAESIEFFSYCTNATLYSRRGQSGSIFYCDSGTQASPYYCATLGILNNQSSSISIR